MKTLYTYNNMEKQIQIKSLFVVWAICLLAGLSSCLQYDKAKLLNWQYGDQEVSDNTEWVIQKGETWKAEGSYRNFILKGQALTTPKAEAALLFHSDGKSGYEVLFRNGEIDGIDYHFISKEDFLHKIDEGFFAEYKSYDTEFGTWYYGTALCDLENAEDNTVVILTPDGYRDVCKKLENKPTCIYIYANNSTIKKRLVKRGDNENEANRRLTHDNVDFKGFEYEADRIIYNNDGTNIKDVVNKVLEFIEEE
jgi:guanylate kinase